jgi:copper chaperone
MTTFKVEDMSCGHCVSMITKAVKSADANATVEVKLDQHLVVIEAATADAETLKEAISDAGYTPQLV